MSEIVLNYTGLDNVPGKIVFNKSSDYFEWINRNKSKVESEVCEIDINEVKANGTYIIKPEKEGTYYSQVKIAVDVPRKIAVNSLGVRMVSGVNITGSTFKFSDMYVMDISSSADLIGGDATLATCLLTIGDLPTFLSLGHVTEDFYLTSGQENTVFLIISASGSLITMKLYNLSTLGKIPKDSYVLSITNGVSSDAILDSATFTYGIYNGDAPIATFATNYKQLFDGTSKTFEWSLLRNANDYSEVYAKCPTLEN